MNNEYQEQPPPYDRSSFGSVLRWILRKIWAVVRVYFISVGFLFTMIPVIIGIAILYSSRERDEESRIMTDMWSDQDSIMIDLRLSGQLIDKAPSLEEQILHRIFGGTRQISMASLRQTLRRAAKKKNVLGIFIEHSSLVASQTSYGELRRLLQEVKEAGKKVYFWSAEYDTNAYFLASIADEISLAPAGGVDVTGPAFQLIYFGEALRKLGVEVEVMRAGKYKNVFEALTSNQPSPEVRGMYESLEENVRALLCEDIAATRNKPVEITRAWLKQSLFTSTDALNEGLIDRIEFVDQMKERTEKSFKKDDSDFDFMSMRKFLRLTAQSEEAELGDGQNGLGLIESTGEIVMDENGADEELITPLQLQKEVDWLIDNDQVKAVVLRVNSPGGSATASDLIWHDLKRLAEKKPLVISMSEVAASGGYYIAAAGQKIYAEPMTITGSIGVIGAIPKFPGFPEKYGVNFYMVTQSDRAKLLNPGEKTSPFDRQIVEHSIDHTYQLFLQRVAEGRKMKVEQVHELAQGRVYTGRQALENGLVDDLGGINEAFRTAKELGGLNPKKLYNIYQYESEELDLSECVQSVTNLFDCLSELDAGVLASKLISMNKNNSYFHEDLRQLARIHGLLASGERVYTLFPYWNQR